MRKLILSFLLLVTVVPVSAQTPEIRLGRAVSGSLAAGDTAHYTFTAGAERFVFASVDPSSTNMRLEVLDPEGETLRAVGGPSAGTRWVRMETSVDGVHEVMVIASSDSAAEYGFTIEKIEKIATNPKKLADQLFSIYDHEDTPGGEVAVWRDGKRLFAKAYGMANLTYKLPYRIDTRTNIGSTSKQFTAFAVMLLVGEGKVDLDSTVQTYIPELPEFDEPVTVRNLLTHTTGYREFLNLVGMSGRRLDHGDYIDRSELISIVQRQEKLQNSPGSEWNYNNTSFGLASIIVERVSGMDFPNFLRERVFLPLGMNSTLVRVNPEMIVPNASMGYSSSGLGKFVEKRDISGAMGAGAIYSTVGDLQLWVSNFDDPKVGSRDLLDQMMTRFVLTTGDTTSYGFGLFISEQSGLKKIDHGGADVAHRSQLFYFPQINAGITTQSNNAGFDGSIATKLAAAFFKDAMDSSEDEGEDEQAETKFDVSEYDPEDFDVLVGSYSMDISPAFILKFSREGDTLFTQATGQDKFPIFPTSDSTFALKVVEASVTFHVEPDGSVEGITLHQGGANRHATRLGQETKWAEDAGVLSQFTGRFYSEELEAFYTLEVRGDTLVAMNRRLDDISLVSGREPGSFSGGDMEWEFERDRNDRVIALYLANGRTRDVKFERVQ